MPAEIIIKTPDEKLGKNLANCHRATVQDMLNKIDKDGFFHTSSSDAPIFNEKRRCVGKGTHYNTCWTRDAGRGIIELSRLGYDDVCKCCLWLGQHLLYTPPRWIRTYSRDGQNMVSKDPWYGGSHGELEIDGHAAVLLGFAHTLKYFGDKEYREKLWASYITGLKWLFIHSEMSQYHHLLFTESEVSERASGSYDIYSNVLAVEALRGAIELCLVYEDDKTSPYFSTYGHDITLLQRLQRTIERDIYLYLCDKKNKMWLQGRFSDGRVQDYMCHSLARVFPFKHALFQVTPLTISADINGYLPLIDQPRSWVKTSKTTFDSIYKISKKWLHEKRCPVFYVGNAYGIVPPIERSQDVLHTTSIQFGHGLFTEASMLLDEMEIFEKSITTIAYGVNNPHFGKKYQYVTPALCFNGKNIYGVGDVGNLVNSAEFLKIIRLMAGIDDSRGTLRIVPRLPKGWGIKVTDMPVAIAKRGNIERGKVSYEYTQVQKEWKMKIDIEGNLSPFSVRLGPISKNLRRNKFRVSGRRIKWQESGDSRWAILKEISQRHVELSLKVK